MTTLVCIGLAQDAANPMKLLINEIGFGPDGYAELYSHAINEQMEPQIQDEHGYQRLHNLQDYKFLAAKKVKTKPGAYRSARFKILGIVDLSNMKITKDEYLLMTIKNIPNIPLQSSNVIKSIMNTKLGQMVQTEEFFKMDSSDNMIFLLLHGDIESGLQRKALTEQVMASLKPNIVDGLLFGGVDADIPYNMLPYLSDNKRKMQLRRDSGVEHSFSRCSSTYTPFRSFAFRDTNKTPAKEESLYYISKFLMPIYEMSHLTSINFTYNSYFT